MMKPNVKVIVNPVAGSNSVRRKWPQINRRLQQLGLLFDYELTGTRGDAIKIASRAADIGYKYIIAVGGDGTINEVANGILSSSNVHGIVLGIVGAGTVCSFARSLGITQDIADTCSPLASQKTALIDVGMVQCWRQGQEVERFFVNEASVIFSAEVVDSWQKLPNLFGHSINLAFRTVAGYTTLATHRNKRITFHIGDKTESIYACTIVVANGKYMADGMQIAPHAVISDNLLDVIIVGDVSKIELLKIRPMLYDGSHVGHPKIAEKKVSSISIESDERFLVEADGDILGEGPVSFRVIPSALTVSV